ncbi:histidine phosphatase superfamily (branch 2) domain-containing protein [Phthorimaea operculella]|nr:histidine phosphatase superfamily (branch 2) domain-containing protein [Phthorimaea operculella]
MAFIQVLLLAAVASLGVSGAAIADRSSPEQGTELVFAFMVHRHGDRTPAERNVLASLGLDNEEVNALIRQWGYGQLTNVGRRTAYNLGEFIRRRYDGLIAPRYNDSEIYIRSTDVTRAKMTVLTALSAAFPPVGENWSEDINWVPVPYTTLPEKNDYILDPSSSCPRLNQKLFASEDEVPVLPGFEEVLYKLAGVLGNTDIMEPDAVFAAWSDLESLVSMGYDLGEELTELYYQLFPAFDASWAYVFHSDDAITMGAGVLLNEFFEYADKIIKGEQTQKVRWYSAHDTNVYPFQEATKVIPQGKPMYGALYSLELRKIVATGEYVVLPVYLSDPNEGKETLLQVSGCDVLCDYERFKNITSVHRIDENQAKEMC